MLRRCSTRCYSRAHSGARHRNRGLWPARDATEPFLNFVRAILSAAIVPIVIVSMRVGPAPKIFLILLNTIDGVRGMNPQMLEMARAFRIPFGIRSRRNLFMGALPQIMAWGATLLTGLLGIF